MEAFFENLVLGTEGGRCGADAEHRRKQSLHLHGDEDLAGRPNFLTSCCSASRSHWSHQLQGSFSQGHQVQPAHQNKPKGLSSHCPSYFCLPTPIHFICPCGQPLQMKITPAPFPGKPYWCLQMHRHCQSWSIYRLFLRLLKLIPRSASSVKSHMKRLIYRQRSFISHCWLRSS